MSENNAPRTQKPAAWITDPLLMQVAPDGTISVSAMQLRQDRAREVALQCAVAFAAPVPDAIESEILGTASLFLPFLLGEDKL